MYTQTLCYSSRAHTHIHVTRSLSLFLCTVQLMEFQQVVHKPTELNTEQLLSFIVWFKLLYFCIAQPFAPSLSVSSVVSVILMLMLLLLLLLLYTMNLIKVKSFENFPSKNRIEVDKKKNACI